MKSQTQNPLVPSLTAFAAALLVCGAVTISAAEEDFPTLVKRLQQQKPTFAKRHQDLLAQRYDLADRPAQGVTMSRGKPVQEGVRVAVRVTGDEDERQVGAIGSAVRERLERRLERGVVGRSADGEP